MCGQHPLDRELANGKLKTWELEDLRHWRWPPAESDVF